MATVAGGSETCFAGVRLLLPAHSMIVDESGIRSWRYWDYDAERSSASFNFERPDRTFYQLLEDSVRLRLRSDVPVGACLSRGLDSTSVVGLANQLTHRSAQTVPVHSY